MLWSDYAPSGQAELWKSGRQTIPYPNNTFLMNCFAGVQPLARWDAISLRALCVAVRRRSFRGRPRGAAGVLLPAYRPLLTRRCAVRNLGAIEAFAVFCPKLAG